MGEGTNEGSKRDELQGVRVACVLGSAVGPGVTCSFVPFGEVAVAKAWRLMGGGEE